MNARYSVSISRREQFIANYNGNIFLSRAVFSICALCLFKLQHESKRPFSRNQTIFNKETNDEIDMACLCVYARRARLDVEMEARLN